MRITSAAQGFGPASALAGFSLALALALTPALVRAQTPAAPETIGEVRVHGNASIADADVLKLAGIGVGDPLPSDAVAAIERRLHDSGRFESVEVRKRYRSLTDAGDVALVIVVHERPAAIGGSPVTRPFRTVARHVMFLPILGYADGYGLTYGVRSSTVDLLGAGERLSVPLSWGATRRAALEVDRDIARGPIDRVMASAGVMSRDNPRFDLADHRTELRARAERRIPGGIRLGTEIGRADVTFGTLDEAQWTFTTDASIDTRNDPSFPRTGVLARTGWTGLHLPSRPRIDQFRSEIRAFQPLVGQSVLAVRALYVTADATLPPYERLLAGGGSTLRGYRAGAFDGDRLALVSAEARMPLTSVVGGGRAGLTIFGDTAAAYDHDQKLSSARFHRGAGVGFFVSASVFAFNVDVARNDEGRQRAHLSFGFTF